MHPMKPLPFGGCLLNLLLMSAAALGPGSDGVERRLRLAGEPLAVDGSRQRQRQRHCGAELVRRRGLAPAASAAAVAAAGQAGRRRHRQSRAVRGRVPGGLHGMMRPARLISCVVHASAGARVDQVLLLVGITPYRRLLGITGCADTLTYAWDRRIATRPALRQRRCRLQWRSAGQVRVRGLLLLHQGGHIF